MLPKSDRIFRLKNNLNDLICFIYNCQLYIYLSGSNFSRFIKKSKGLYYTYYTYYDRLRTLIKVDNNGRK